MNPNLNRLQPYPFEKLHQLKDGLQAPADRSPIALSIGEPKHEPPHFVIEELISHLHGLGNYPLTKGSAPLREAIAAWLQRRFDLTASSQNSRGIDPETQILPVNGTREALFAFAQAVVDRDTNPLVIMPNPFYQIYEGAALLAGAELWFLNIQANTGFVPDIDSVPVDVWRRCQLIYLCSPGNPTGAVVDAATLRHLITLADEHDFIIAADECYSEIYFDEDRPPVGLLQVAAEMGRTDYRRCVVFHSLSKRSNLPGLRSGFVAGDAEVLAKFLLYRTYHGSAMSPPTQAASTKAWSDEVHVKRNRELYREKFAAVLDILRPVLGVEKPQAGFYLWAQTPVCDEVFARDLFVQQNVNVVPGSYLSRDAHGINPGKNHVRMALVTPLQECIDAAKRIRSYVEALP
ncbi:N-succinyl-L,L-diaminopimelate aminotransferase, type 2 [hydrothermal vent metagenome]|uniref:N-succinyl-L,L-diaminopimelate aminotransferase, type 2 n=1 Tax=hydrothermal vent metagenome TaxID=652676 RepID=A0A3B1ATB0_9ZZZZ